VPDERRLDHDVTTITDRCRSELARDAFAETTSGRLIKRLASKLTPTHFLALPTAPRLAA